MSGLLCFTQLTLDKGHFHHIYSLLLLEKQNPCPNDRRLKTSLITVFAALEKISMDSGLYSAFCLV